MLLSLSEHTVFRNMFAGAGAIPPLLSLLVNQVKSLSVTAACILSSLSEAGLSREQLCQDPALVAMLRTLQVCMGAKHCMACTLSNYLLDAGLGRAQLCQDPALVVMLCTLQVHTKHASLLVSAVLLVACRVQACVLLIPHL